MDMMPSNAGGPRRPASGSQPRADRTREAFLEETIRCIRADGFAAASTRRIADQAGLTWGAVQYHFGDRAGLLMAVVDEGLAGLRDTLRNVPEATAGMPTRRRVEHVVDTAWEAFTSPSSMAAMEILISTRSMRGEWADRHLKEVAAAFSGLGQQLGAGLSARHAKTIGTMILDNLRGMAAAQMTVDEKLSAKKQRRALTDVLTAYIEQEQTPN